MQRLLDLTLLTLSLAVPTASLALGLGDIHVESALHQPLVAQIELVGATDDELGRLSAAIASDEIFERYNLERAPFIYGTKLVVGRDGQGHPVLNLRSTEKFTEPVVTLLVDLHAPNGELIREYTIFLDPPGMASKPSGVESTSATPATSVSSPAPISSRAGGPSPTLVSSRTAGSSPAAVAATAAAQALTTVAAPERAIAGPDINSGASTNAGVGTNAGADTNLLGNTYIVARRDTLDHIVSAAGAHSRIDRHRMMIAIFRANPAAFQNNFNKLHTGVTLHFPSAEQLAAIPAKEVSREYDAQMAAWRMSGHRVAPAAPQPVSTMPVRPGGSTKTAAANSVTRDSASTDSSAASGAAPAGIGDGDVGANSKPGADSQETDRAVLTKRVASLEKSLDQLQQELKQPLVVQKPAPVAAAAAPAPEPEVTADEDEDAPRPAPHHKLLLLASLFVAIGVVLVLVLAIGVWIYRRRWNAASHPAMAPARMNVKDDQPVELSKEFSKAQPPLSHIALGAVPPVEKAPSEPLQSSAKVPGSTSSWFEESFSTPIAELLANDPMATQAMASPAPETTAELAVETTAKLPAAQLEDPDTTVMLAPDFDVVGDTVEQKFSFFNPESANNTEHVVMSSGLNEPKPFVERRKNPADVLRQAIEREPGRSDLRLKLLELYYTAAAENRRAFLDATRQLAKNEKLASPEDWSRIADMGRTIAPDDKLFADELDDKRVA